MILIIMVWSSITSLLTLGTYGYEDCKKLDFKPKACAVSKLGKDSVVK